LYLHFVFVFYPSGENKDLKDLKILHVGVVCQLSWKRRTRMWSKLMSNIFSKILFKPVDIPNTITNKKTVLSQRCALYKWIEWAVAEIWPFEIIQDGGLPQTWIWCNQK